MLWLLLRRSLLLLATLAQTLPSSRHSVSCSNVLQVLRSRLSVAPRFQRAVRAYHSAPSGEYEEMSRAFEHAARIYDKSLTSWRVQDVDYHQMAAAVICRGAQKSNGILYEAITWAVNDAQIPIEYRQAFERGGRELPSISTATVRRMLENTNNHGMALLKVNSVPFERNHLWQLHNGLDENGEAVVVHIPQPDVVRVLSTVESFVQSLESAYGDRVDPLGVLTRRMGVVTRHILRKVAAVTNVNESKDDSI